MELVLEVNNPGDREGAFIKAVVEQILHKKPLGHAIRYWWNPCMHNLFGQTSFACEGSATSICRCQLSSPLPVRESSVRLELPRRCALVWSYLIYAGINILWGFSFSWLQDFHMKVPQATAFILLSVTSWAETQGWFAGIHKVASPHSHFRAN